MLNFLEHGRNILNVFGITTPGQHDEAFQAQLLQVQELVKHLRAGGTIGVEGTEEVLQELSQLEGWWEFVDVVDGAENE